ncbi:MAG TPA: crossover junction endodeoxyribonuclease RuvC [Ktedonobacterales bacterium]|nr:crossover junction endodeoxyribonuclease RuvC [Ktedonobacterales bacterium]
MSPTPVKQKTARPPRRALGIDPGTARLGYALIEEQRGALSLLACGCIETPAGQPMPARLLQLFEALSAIVREHEPREMAIEELFFAKNVTTVISVGQARGIALLVAAQAGLTVSEYKPMQVKQAVHGYGLAKKEQVGEMVRVLLGLPSVPKPDDAADAAAIAICHLHTMRVQELT